MPNESTATATTEASAGAPESNSSPQSQPAAGAAPVQPKPGETPAEAQARKYKLKFGNQERELDEASVVALAQKGWASDEKFQEAARTKKQVAQLLQNLKNDPDTTLRKLGIENPTEFYKQRVAEQLKREMLSPAERKALELEEQLNQYRQREEVGKKQAEEAELKRLEQHYAAEYDKQITEAITTVGVPKTPRTVARMADLMAKNLEHGLELPAKHIAEIVREEYMTEVKELLGGYGDEKLLDVLGPDLLKKVQTMDAKRRKVVSKPPVNPVVNKAKAEGKQVDGDGKVIASRDEWREHLEKWKNS